MALRITIEDLEAGTSETSEMDDDYCLTVAGRAYVSRIQTYHNGTHVITVKRPGHTVAIAKTIEYDPPARAGDSLEGPNDAG